MALQYCYRPLKFTTALSWGSMQVTGFGTQKCTKKRPNLGTHTLLIEFYVQLNCIFGYILYKVCLGHDMGILGYLFVITFHGRNLN